MSTFLMGLSSLNSCILLLNKTPSLLIFLVISQTIIICGILKTTFSTAWFAMLLFLIFVGGLMILFTYITSLAPNELLTKYNNLFMYLWMSFILLSMLSLIAVISEFPLTTQMFSSPSSSFITLIFKIYSHQLWLLMLCLFFFLLLVLLISVFIILINKGPLRSGLMKLTKT